MFVASAARCRFITRAEWVSSAAVLRNTDDNPYPIVFLTARLPNSQVRPVGVYRCASCVAVIT